MMKLLETHDAVVGSRYIAGGGTENWSFMRKLISRGGSVYGRLVLGLETRDLTGGFNGWSRKVLQAINPDNVKSEGYAFQIELKYRCQKLGFQVFEMPIIFSERRAGHSKMSWKIVVEAMWRLWQFRAIEIEPAVQKVQS